MCTPFLLLPCILLLPRTHHWLRLANVLSEKNVPEGEKFRNNAGTNRVYSNRSIVESVVKQITSCLQCNSSPLHKRLDVFNILETNTTRGNPCSERHVRK